MYVNALEKAVQEVANSSLSDTSDFDSSDNDTEVVIAKEIDNEVVVGKVADSSKPHETIAVFKFKMASYKVVSTIEKVYMEWYKGWDGRPSIVELTDKHNLMWRYKEDEKIYSRRRKIICEIQKIVNEGNSIESAIEILETRRGKKAISTFADSL